MQLLSPSSFLVAARQPGKVLGRALLRACGWLSLLGVTRKGHHGLTAQSHRCLLPCPLVGQSWFILCFRKVPREGRAGMLGTVPAVTARGHSDPDWVSGDWGLQPPEPKAVESTGAGSDVECVV